MSWNRFLEEKNLADERMLQRIEKIQPVRGGNRKVGRALKAWDELSGNEFRGAADMKD